MRKLIISLILLCTATTSFSVPVGHTGGGGGDPRGTYKAIAKTRSTHTIPGPGGSTVVYSWRYHHISASNQSYCQQQLNAMTANPNTFVHQACIPE